MDYVDMAVLLEWEYIGEQSSNYIEIARWL